MIPGIFNVVMLVGFMTLDAIIGGQTLSSVTDGRLSWRYVGTYNALPLYSCFFSIGIIVIILISLFVS